MKRIGIMSDTHGYWDDRFAKYFSECDEIWHAGDIGDISILYRLEDICPKVRAVCGNIDHGEVRRRCEELLIFDCEKFRVLLTHIGGYPGKYSKGLKDLMRENEINLMVCGHSHILKVMYDHSLGIMHLNPGACGLSGWQKKRTLLRLEVDNDKLSNLEIIELN